jgi:hypothetical protein
MLNIRRSLKLAFPLLVVNPIPLISAEYVLSSYSIDQAGNTLVPGNIIHVTWSLQNTPGPLDTCYFAVRSLTNMVDANAYVTDMHIACDAYSFNMEIPLKPNDTALLYNGGSFVVRFIPPGGPATDSQVFK